MTEKTQEQRIADAAQKYKEIASRTYNQVVFPTDNFLEQLVKAILEAADAPVKPKWPTDESVTTLRDYFGFQRAEPGSYSFTNAKSYLKSAMLKDPIIQAAIAYRDAYFNPGYNVGRTGFNLVNAVNKAGL